MRSIDAESIGGFAPVAVGCLLVLIAGYNYVEGVYGGAIVVGVGAIITFVLVVLSE